MKIDFEFISHDCEGRTYRLALDKSATDSYTESLRTKPRSEPYLHYALSRSAQLGRPLKIADVGANVGGLALPLAAHGMQILAVEASPRNFIALATSVRENRFNNVLPINMAVYDAPGLVDLSGSSAWATISQMDKSASVAADTLAGILDIYGFADSDLIKLDIEGAELAALTGVEQLLSSNPALEIIYESNTHTSRLFGHDQQTLANRFAELGFHLYAFRSGGLMPLKAKDPKPAHLLDVLATRRTDADLLASGLKIVAMTDHHLLQSLLQHAKSGHKFLVTHAALQEQYMGDDIRSSPEWSCVKHILSESNGKDAA